MCGIGLVGAVAWLWMPQPDISGPRSAEVVAEASLPPKLIAASLSDARPDVRARVLQRFAEDSEWLRSSHAEVEFSATPDGLLIRVAQGRKTQFVRFHIDDGLRKRYDAHSKELDAEHKANLSAALSAFLNEWDVAIRNQTGIDEFMKFRDSVGLAGCVHGLGYNISARIDGRLYPCVYENDSALYFLLPHNTKTFQVVGFRANGDPSAFPGEYQVTVKPVSTAGGQ